MAFRGLGTGTLTLAQAIARQENTNPVYNNPGALMAAPSSYCQNGKASNGMVIFCTPQDGANALDNQISLEEGQGLTLSQMISSYAPASVPGNNPTGYTQNVAGWTGIDPSIPLNTYDPSLLFASTSIDATTGTDIGTQVASLLGGDLSNVDWGLIGLGLVAIYAISRII